MIKHPRKHLKAARVAGGRGNIEVQTRYRPRKHLGSYIFTLV
jgi:hypothetical protein